MGKQILNIATGVLLGLGATLVGTSYNLDPKEIQKSVRIERKTRSLEELVKTDLPQKFKDMGFRVGKYVNKGTNKEIIIIAEDHSSDNLLDKKKELILHLAKNYGVDSLGLEGFAGEYPDMKPRSTLGFLWDDEYLQNMRNFLFENKVNVTYFGLENRNLNKFLESVEADFFHYPSKEDVEKNAALLDLPKGLPTTGLFYDKNGMRDEVKNHYGIELKIRSREFARTIADFLQKDKSRRSVICVGANHIEFPFKEIGTMLDHLHYSSLIIYGPNVTEEDRENQEKNSPEIFNVDNETLIKKIKELKDV